MHMHDVEEVEMFHVFSSKSVTQTSWSELFQFLQEDDLPEIRSLETLAMIKPHRQCELLRMMDAQSNAPICGAPFSL